ncbi:MAG: DUF460 domain-containing protein [Candidatus Micrarchaeia archaeon]
MNIIVGIDPGKTSALACMSLDGNILCLTSKKLAGLMWFVETIEKYGTPVLVSFDKKNSDNMVKKLAAIFGTQIYLPKADISVEKKKKMSEGLNFSNLHERDALVSAITAYNSYSNKFNQAERLAKEKNFDDVEKLKVMIVKKYSIDEAIKGKPAGRVKKLW